MLWLCMVELGFLILFTPSVIFGYKAGEPISFPNLNYHSKAFNFGIGILILSLILLMIIVVFLSRDEIPKKENDKF